MVSKLLCSAAAIAFACAGCAPGATTLAQAETACQSNPSSWHHVEVYVPSAVVVRVLGVRDSASGMHEGFTFVSGGGDRRQFLVEDNTGITGPIPLRRGDRISLLGQFECNDDVIHWTHHDPSGRHAPGYIEVDGKRYQ